MPVIKIRRGTTQQWAASNRVLQLGELGLDTTLNKLKAGNGTTAWSSLAFLQADVDITELAQDAVATALANGTHSNITVTYDDAANKISLATGPDVITQTSLANTLTNPTTGYVPVGDVGQADGVASLDSNGKIPDSEIPSTIARDSEIPSLTGYATETYVGTAISNLVDSSPATLNTLNELAEALGDDPNYATTISTSLGNKEPLLPSQTGNSGKFLTTNGTSKSWAIIPSTPTATNTAVGTVYAATPENSAQRLSLGFGAGNGLGASTAGNVAIGYVSMYLNSSGSSNTGLGAYTFNDLNSGNNNLAIGFNAGGGLTSGSNNIIIGSGAAPSSAIVSNEITLGNADISSFRISGLGINWTRSNIPVLQSEPAVDYYITNAGAGAYVVNGVSSGPIVFEKGKKYRVHVNATGHPFWIQTTFGAYSIDNVYSNGITNNGTQQGHIIVELPQDAPSNLYYVCQFHSSMKGYIYTSNASTPTIRGTVFGTTGVNSNTGIGESALANISSGAANTAIGSAALQNTTTAYQNTALGRFALTTNTSGQFNVAVGYASLLSSNSSGNVAVGQDSLGSLSSGEYNVAIGFNAGGGNGATNLTTGSNNIVIGKDVISSSPTVSNQITLGNSSITNFRIPGLAVNWTTSAYGRATYASTSAPSGGADGDVWLVYTA